MTTSSQSNKTPEQIAVDELLQSAKCLYLELAEPVADDVMKKVNAVVAFIEQLKWQVSECSVYAKKCLEYEKTIKLYQAINSKPMTEAEAEKIITTHSNTIRELREALGFFYRSSGTRFLELAEGNKLDLQETVEKWEKGKSLLTKSEEGSGK